MPVFVIDFIEAGIASVEVAVLDLDTGERSEEQFVDVKAQRSWKPGQVYGFDGKRWRRSKFLEELFLSQVTTPVTTPGGDIIISPPPPVVVPPQRFSVAAIGANPRAFMQDVATISWEKVAAKWGVTVAQAQAAEGQLNAQGWRRAAGVVYYNNKPV